MHAVEHTEYRGTIVNSRLETDKLQGFRGLESDVWIAGFPRSGTTLTQELTYLVNTRDFEKARTQPQSQRILFTDIADTRIPYHEGLSACENMPPPRMFKTHLHYFLLPDDIQAGRGRLVYVARHPASAALSLYGLMKMFKLVPQTTSLEEFMEAFLDDKAYGCPWWLHVLQYWEHRHDDHILFLQYEDIVKDKSGTIRRLAEFLSKDLTDDDVTGILAHTDIDRMREDDNLNFSFAEKYMVDKEQRFINSGKVDGWRDLLSDDLQRRIEAMMMKRLGHTDIKFST